MYDIAITMGDPAGIGPEIVVKALQGLTHASSSTRSVVLGDPAVLQASADRLGISAQVAEISSMDECCPAPGVIPVVRTSAHGAPTELGCVAAEHGRAACQAVVTGIDLAMSGQVRALVTAPVNKASFAMAGISYPGHTELLADRSGAGDVAMMLQNDLLRAVLVTIHCSLRQAIDRADFDAQCRAIRFAHAGCRAQGIDAPRIAIAGLNPHAGEGGLFGDEERQIIGPAIAAMRAGGLNVTGPVSGDTVFMQARQGQFDVVVAQYHDQGLIPVKYMGLDDGVNITLGLPFIRTSPDHGTAFDIAGTGRASASSLIAAIRTAERMIRHDAGQWGQGS